MMFVRMIGIQPNLINLFCVLQGKTSIEVVIIMVMVMVLWLQ